LGETEQVHDTKRVTLKTRSAVNSPESELSLIYGALHYQTLFQGGDFSLNLLNL
jgi:hypothetical protein